MYQENHGIAAWFFYEEEEKGQELTACREDACCRMLVSARRQTSAPGIYDLFSENSFFSCRINNFSREFMV